jgi:hypothetical protein
MSAENNQVNVSKIIDSFRKNQTLSGLQDLANLGIGLKILKGNEWQRLSEFKLPFERFITLYEKRNGVFEISNIGVY